MFATSAFSLARSISVTHPSFPEQKEAPEGAVPLSVLDVLLLNAQLCRCSLRPHREGNSHLLNLLSTGDFICMISSGPLSHIVNKARLVFILCKQEVLWDI